MGPPWLVVVLRQGANYEVIFRDNFTGAGFERVRRVIRDEPGAISAVMGKAGQLAKQRDGTLFQPIAQMKGRNFGTPADRGHKAYLIACELLGERPHPLASAGARNAWIVDTMKWSALALVGLVLLLLAVG